MRATRTKRPTDSRPERRAGSSARAAFAATIFAAGCFFSAPCRAQVAPPTPAEEASFECSPTWKELAQYVSALSGMRPEIRIYPFGASSGGRRMSIFQVFSSSKKGKEETEPEKPVVFILAGIHGGEICGKDAILMLLRDIANGKEREIREKLHLIIVPVFNLDGHEERGTHNRFTQEGPACGTGKRRSALNLDLNRDYAKIETIEVRNLVRQISISRPHLFLDLHTDDGIGHQYDVVYGASVNPTLPGERDRLVREKMEPYIRRSMKKAGFRTHRIGQPVDRKNPTEGIATYGIQGRVGTGYFDYRHTISILSEANPYVSYERRVRGTYAFLRTVLRFAAANAGEIVETVEDAREEAKQWALESGEHEIALTCLADRSRPVTIDWLGKEFDVVTSAVTGEEYAVYGEKNKTYRLPFFGEIRPDVTATMPAGYLIEKPWTEIIRKLKGHGIESYVVGEPFHGTVETFRIENVRFSERPYQGHHPIVEIDGEMEATTRLFPSGTHWVPLDQENGIVAMMLLEPKSPDALLAWNYFDTIFERGIVLERWALEENARKMLADPAVRKEYETALADSAFAADPEKRLLHFFEKTPYAEEGYAVYPVHRLLAGEPASYHR